MCSDGSSNKPLIIHNKPRSFFLSDTENHEHCCPIDGCTATFRRMDKHLQTKRHKLRPGNPEYHRYLKMGQKTCRSEDVDQQTKPVEDVVNEEAIPDESDTDEDYVPSDVEGDEEGDESDSVLDRDINDEMKSEIPAFKKWLESFGGGSKSKASCSQTAQQVKLVLKNFGDQSFRHDSIISNLDQIEQEFIPKMLETKQASTVKNHLLSFQKFVKWGTMKQKQWISNDCADSVNDHIKMWNTSLHKMISTRAHEKKELHRRAIVTVEQVQAYLNGDRAQKAQEILENSDSSESISQQDHTISRNHLIMLLVLANASRAGPVINLTIEEVLNAEDNIHGDRCVINVLVHKTEEKYGTAQISLSTDEYELLRAYIENIRARVPAPFKNEEAVFITWSGREMSQSEVANVITRELIRAGGRDVRSSCTIMRKSIVSILLQMNLGARTEQDLASLMKHSQNMQKKTYDIRVADNAMAKMSGLVFKVMAGKNLNEHDLVEEKV